MPTGTGVSLSSHSTLVRLPVRQPTASTLHLRSLEISQAQALDLVHHTQVLSRQLAHELPALLHHLHKGIVVPNSVGGCCSSSRN